MPFLQVQTSKVKLDNVDASVVQQGLWTVPVNRYDAPNLNERWDLLSIWLPLAFTALKGPATGPTVCNLTTQLLVSGDLVYQQTIQINAIAFGVGGLWGAGYGSVNASLPNPIGFRSGQSLSIGYQANVDADASEIDLWLCAIVPDPTVPVVAPSPGTIGYTIAAESWATVP